MVLDPIPHSLPVHFFGSWPQPPTSHYHTPVRIYLQVFCMTAHAQRELCWYYKPTKLSGTNDFRLLFSKCLLVQIKCVLTKSSGQFYYRQGQAPYVYTHTYTYIHAGLFCEKSVYTYIYIYIYIRSGLFSRISEISPIMMVPFVNTAQTERSALRTEL